MRKLALLAALFLLGLYLFLITEFHVSPHLASTAEPLYLPKMEEKLPKVILIVIDALRYDYLAKLSFFRPGEPNSFLSKITVASPTMTTPRVESLMTGSQIFSVTNILDNFLSRKISISNIVGSLEGSQTQTYAYGDDTWTKLFHFNHVKTCPTTFDIKDYETCDQTIYNNLLNDVAKQPPSFLVAHFLAIDHVGHATSGIIDPAIQNYLHKISRFIGQLMAEMPQGSMLIITGDHGMRSDGNHGGTTPQETETVVFGYYKGGAQYRQMQGSRRQLRHVDITSTLAAWLKVPLPSNCIGYPILQLLPERYVREQFERIHETMIRQYRSILDYHSLLSPLASSLLSSEKYKEDRPKSEIISEFLAIRSEELSKLSHANPNSLLLMSLVLLLVLTGLISVYFVRTSIVLPSQWLVFGVCVFVASVIPYSWYLLRHSSTVLCCCLLILIICCIGFPNKHYILIGLNAEPILTIPVCLLLVLLMAQFESDKVDEYVPSVFQHRALHGIVTNRYFVDIFCALAFTVYFRMNVRSRRFKRRTRQPRLFEHSPKDVVMRMVILLIGLVSTVVAGSNISLLGLGAPAFRVGWIVLVGLYWIIDLNSLDKASLVGSKSKENISKIRFIIVNLAALFLPRQSLIALIVLIYIVKLTANSNFSCYLTFFLSQWLWWLLGNHYQYSSIDIAHTYIFSQTFHASLNALCLLLYLTIPFIFVYALNLLERLEHSSQAVVLLCHHSKVKNPTDMEEMEVLNHNSTLYQTEKYFSRLVDSLHTANLHYLVLAMAITISCCIGLVSNNGKILFTVVYVPLMMLSTLKMITVCLLVLIGQSQGVAYIERRLSQMKKENTKKKQMVYAQVIEESA